METIKLPKFNWGQVSELNSGHTSEEWGKSTKNLLPKTFVAYSVCWD